MSIKQLSVFVENKVGRLTKITKTIADAGVDIRALSVADTSDFGILRLIVDKPEQAVKALQAADITVSLTEVIAVAIEDVPGSFAEVVSLISAEGINIEYMYAFISRSEDRAFIILRVEDNAKACEILKKNGVSLMEESEVYEM